MRIYHAIIVLLVLVQLMFSKGILEQKWSGSYYEENSSPQYQAALKTLNNYPISACSILDIGCGSGKITEELFKRAPGSTIEAIDASESMIKAAQEKHGKNQNITFSVCDAQKLGYSKKFDLVVSFSCAHWIKDKAAFFRGVSDSLRPGGKILMIASAKKATDPVVQSMLALKAKDPWRSLLANVKPEAQYFPLDKNEVEKLLKDSGFESIDVQEDVLPLRFKDKAALANWFMGWLGGIAALSSLPYEQQQLFAQALVEQYASLAPAKPDGSLDYNWTLLVVKAKKREQAKSVPEKMR